jgi:hypothetical protein
MMMDMRDFDDRNLDDDSYKLHMRNASILLDGFNEYAFLIKFPPFALDANIEELREFIDHVREIYYAESGKINFTENYKPWRETENKYTKMLAEARQYRDEYKGAISAAMRGYKADHPKEKLSDFEIVGGHLEM